MAHSSPATAQRLKSSKPYVTADRSATLNDVIEMNDRVRLVDRFDAFSRHMQALRFSPLARGAFLADLPLTLPQLKALGVIAGSGAQGRSGRELASLLGVG